MTSRFKILGRTRLWFGDRFDHEWGQPKLRGMLAALLLHPGRPVPMTELVEWVWPDGKAPASPMNTLDSYAWRTREALRRMDAPPRLTREGGAYRIEVDAHEVDLFEFRAAVEQARAVGLRGDHETASGMLATALGLWTDQPLADLHGERAANWRLWAETELVIPANDMLLQELGALGRFDEMLRRLADLPAGHQANLSLVKRRLEALYGQHRDRDASSYLLRMRKQLRANGEDDEADELLRFNNALRGNGAGTLPAPADDAVHAPDPPHLLRRDVPDFVGRGALLQRLDAATIAPTGEPLVGVVVLDGAAGVGKTALAVHWAHRVAHRFSGGVLHSDLRGFAAGPRMSPAEVVDEFLAALGFPAERVATTAGRVTKLRSLLAGPTLVLLDNALDSDHVESLLDALSGCTVVVTSRRKLTGLGRRGAAAMTVPPLGYLESKAWLTRLLGDRAAGAPGAVDVLAAICGGNLLALRVVAQHVAAVPRVPVDELVDELRDSHTLLGLGDDGDGPDNSVRAVLSWSYRVLGAEERRLFRLLGLHPGPDISVDVAAALAGRDWQQVKRGLDVLVNAHLLNQPESRRRYRLHDLVRKYAAECVAEDRHGAEREAAAERMLSHVLHVANNADAVIFPFKPRVPMPPLADGVVPQEFDTDEAALDWCARERANINAVISFAGEHEMHQYAARLSGTTGEVFQRLGFYQDIIAGLEIALRAARAMGDTVEEADALNNFTHLYLDLGDLAAAESYLLAAEEKYKETDYIVGLAVVAHHRGRIHLERGEFDRGIESYHNSLEMFRQADVKALELRVLHRLAEAYRRRNLFDAAASFCRDALWMAEKLHDDNGRGRCLTELGYIHFEQGELGAARGYCIRALIIHQHQRDRAQAGKTCNLLARVDRVQGNPRSAEEHARMALEFCRSARDARGEAEAHETWAHLLRAQAQIDEAAREWGKALVIYQDIGDVRAESIRVVLDELPSAHPTIPETRTEPLVTKPGVSPPMPGKG